MGSRIPDELEAAFGEELALLGDDLGARAVAIAGLLRHSSYGCGGRALARRRLEIPRAYYHCLSCGEGEAP